MRTNYPSSTNNSAADNLNLLKMTLYIQFIPQVFNKLRGSHQSDYKPWVTKYVNAEVSKLSSVFIKTDGSNQPTADIDFNKQTITNIRKVKAKMILSSGKSSTTYMTLSTQCIKKHMNR